MRLDCPNDRYINDEQICEAVTAMLAKIGVKVNLNAQTRLKYFSQISNPNYDTDFYMLGWTPTTYDALNSLYNLAGSRNGARGIFNDGGYSNPKFDALLDQIQVETDGEKRQEEIGTASKILRTSSAVERTRGMPKIGNEGSSGWMHSLAPSSSATGVTSRKNAIRLARTPSTPMSL